MSAHRQSLQMRPMRRVNRVHFVGIGGVGMAGIAEVLLNLGYQVSGSDIRDGAACKRLRELGATVAIGHAAEHASGADVVVTSTAVSGSNPEVEAAHEHLIPVIRRAEMLAELMRFRYGIAIAGTHGKTTTTSLVAAVLAEGGLDPTFIVGGKVLGAGSNARLGESDYLVAEADESDASFLMLNPLMSVITNIDADHLETYKGDFSQLRSAFLEFVHRLPFYGLAVVCVDDAQVRELLPDIGRPVLTYGIECEADIWAEQLQAEGVGTHFMLRSGDGQEGWPIRLNLPGRHNVLNALAAAAIGRELGVEMSAVQAALTGFAGIGRRSELLGELDFDGRRALLVDDYGHHPREVSAVIAAMQGAWPERRLLVVFQPHRFTRTRDLFEDFCQVLAGLEALVLCDVYAAGEAAIANADGRALARGVRARGKVDPVFAESAGDLAQLLPTVVRDGDLILTLGAGDIGAAAQNLVSTFGVAA